MNYSYLSTKKYISLFIFLILLTFHVHGYSNLSIIVNVKGSQAGGEFAHFKVLVNGEKVGMSFSSPDYENYTFPIPNQNPVEEVRVVFDNDRVIDGHDRNLFVKGIELEGEFFNAPAENVTYVQSNGRVREYRDRMPWNGDLIFDINNRCYGDFLLSSQQEVDEFDCKEIMGKLTISGNDITNLDGLSSLIYVDFLEIIDNESLSSIEGLLSISEVSSGISIINNTSLISLNGLNNVKNIGGPFEIIDNPSLKNVDGLSSLQYCTDYFRIRNNDQLTNLDGLSSFKKVEYDELLIADLYISENDALTNLDGLSSLTSLYYFNVADNSSLKTLPHFTDLTHVFQLSVRGNSNLLLIKGFRTDINIGYTFINDNEKLSNCCTLYPVVKNVSEQAFVSDNGNLCTLDDILDRHSCNKLLVNVKGSQAGGEFAHFKVLVNGEKVGMSFSSPDYENYTFPIPNQNPVEEVRVVFDNDRVIDGHDRNLFVKGIELEGEFFNAPAENVTYVQSNGRVREYRDRMPWNGDLIFELKLANARTANNYTMESMTRDSVVSQTLNAMIFPNPSEGEFSLLLGEFKSNYINITLFDLRGQLLMTKEVQVEPYREFNTIDLSYSDKGVYLLKIGSNKHSADVIKLVIN